MRKRFNFHKLQECLILLFLSIFYILISFFVVGFKTDQIFLVVLVSILFFISKQTKRIIIACIPFIVFWIIFDYMKAFPNYNYNAVSIADLYNAERKWCGFIQEGRLITANEFFAIYNCKILDIITGFFYLSWVTVPIFLTIYFSCRNQVEAIHLPVAFLIVNLIGFGLYYIYPAAPPWYVAKYGFEFIKNTPGDAAGLARFDSAMGINLFRSMYEKSSNVFAAMPSLHSAYPVVALYFTLKKRMVFLSTIVALTAIGIWFSAVYTSHHYVLDVFFGVCCAAVGLLIFELLHNLLQHFRQRK